MKESGLLKDGALETLEKSLGNSDSASEDLFETGERESRRTTSLGRDRFLNLIPRLKPANNERDDAENEIESDVSSGASAASGPSGPNISAADTSMLEAMVSELLMSETADQRTTEAAPLSQSVLTSRRRRLKRPNLFSTEERRKNSILRPRVRPRVKLSSTTTTSQPPAAGQSDQPSQSSQPDQEENIVETSGEKQRPRIPFLPRQRPKFRTRRPFI